MIAPKLYVVFPPKGNRNYEKAMELKPWVDQLPNRVDDIATATLIVPIGGDGLLLHTGHEYYPSQIPFFGINKGTKGFVLNNLTEKDLALNGQPFLAGEELVYTDCHLRKLIMEKEDGSIEEAIAINDVYLKSADVFGSGHCSVRGDDFLIQEVRGDGVIVATPFGSTAYSFNVGGTILEMASRKLVITAIGPTNVRAGGSYKVDDDQTIVIDVKRGPMVAAADGKSFGVVKKVTVAPSSHKLRLAFRSGENFELRRYQLAINDTRLQDIVKDLNENAKVKPSQKWQKSTGG